MELLKTKFGCDILEVQDDFGKIPLHYAAHSDNVEIVTSVLRTQKSLAYVKDKEGLSPLHISARNGCAGVIRTLIAETKGCPYNICELLDKNGRTALHVAVESRKWRVVKMMLSMKEFGDVINKKDKEGNTCLHLASLHRDFWILIMLAGDPRVDKGALNKMGMTAVDICRSSVQHCEFGKIMTLIMTSLILRRNGSLPSLESALLMIKETRSTAEDMKLPPETSEENTNYNIKAGEKPFQHDNTNSNTARDQLGSNGDNKLSGEHVKNVVNINLVVATIIASITFAAAIQVPGGYDDTGMAILRDKTSFRYFLVYDSMAFGFSAASMFIHYLASFHSGFVQDMQLYPISSVMILTYASIASSVLAFVMSTKSVLETRSSQLEFPFSFDNLGLAGIIACSAFCIPICLFLIRFLSAIIYKIL
ncbi:Transmembrane protein [Parasponia andersonii]|uniref:Transmembrane protein n=1 Tax=Parasponia andersonii TaxID=3476 RepID=A0A2P5BU43_PARAD|nr:Transmembrane protein [Parasponia andersonii]